MDDGSWNQVKLLEVLPMALVSQVLDVEIFDEVNDFPVWTSDQHGLLLASQLENP